MIELYICLWLLKLRKSENDKMKPLPALLCGVLAKNAVFFLNTAASYNTLSCCLHLTFQKLITCSTAVLQCYRRQAIPMEQGKIRPSVTLYSLDRSLPNLVWLSEEHKNTLYIFVHSAYLRERKTNKQKWDSRLSAAGKSWAIRVDSSRCHRKKNRLNWLSQIFS